MKSFCKKVIEHMYDTRLEDFISSFYELYGRYKHLNEDDFFREWFDRFVVRSLMKYFSPVIISENLEEVRHIKRKAYVTYVRTYWSLCSYPRRYPGRVEEAKRFFNIEELNMKTLKRAYRNMVRENHPDRVGRSKKSHLNMVKINYYYQILKGYLENVAA